MEGVGQSGVVLCEGSIFFGSKRRLSFTLHTRQVFLDFIIASNPGKGREVYASHTHNSYKSDEHFKVFYPPFC
jgi:hypothetical protein